MCWCDPSIRTICCGKISCIPHNKTADEKLKELRDKAMEDRQRAEMSMYAYARECEVGDERTAAFEAYERIRTATRRNV